MYCKVSVLAELTRPDCRMEQCLQVIVDLSRHRDRILESSVIDLQALAALVEDCEAAGCTCMAEGLRRKLELYKEEINPKGLRDL